MLETMGHALIPGARGKRKKGAQQADDAPSAATARNDGAAGGDGDNVWGKLLNGGGLSQKDIEWVRIKSFMDEKKR